MVKATLISIGDEILIGQIVNTNTVYLAKKLYEIGVKTEQMLTIADTSQAITHALDQVASTTDLVILTGGLGPTNDDVTKHTLCTYFNDTLVLYPHILEHIKKFLEKHTTATLNKKNKEQAWLPEKATILNNPFGTASGMWFEDGQKVCISLPGVPFEMERLMEDVVLPKLQKRFALPFLYHKTVLTHGLAESMLAERMETWEKELPAHVKIAYLPSFGNVRLRISSEGTEEAWVKKEVHTQVEKLLPLISDFFVGYETDSLEEMVARKLTEKKATLALAESCTGGALAATLTTLPGASAYFLGSAVTYATKAKEKMLSIPKALLDTHGVVSATTAAAMAKGAQEKFNADYAISITGNAGPTAGDPRTEVGTIFIGIAHSNTVRTEQFRFGNRRKRTIQKAVQKALILLLKEIERSD